MINWNDVKKDYDGGLTDAELAEKYGIKKNTIKVHRNRNKWGPANRAKRKYKKRNSTSDGNRNVTKKETVTDTDTTDTCTDTFDSVIESADGLNDKQRLFCLYYYQLGNATRAYIKAYDCSYATANTNAYLLLVNQGIQNYINDLKKRFASKQVKTTEDMLNTLVNQATSDIGDYIDFHTVKVLRTDQDGAPIADSDGNEIHDHQTSIWLKDRSKMDLTLVNEIHKGKDGVVVKMYDKQKAIFKLLDMLPEPDTGENKENTFLRALQAGEQQVGDELPNFEMKRPLRAPENDDENN